MKKEDTLFKPFLDLIRVIHRFQQIVMMVVKRFSRIKTYLENLYRNFVNKDFKFFMSINNNTLLSCLISGHLSPLKGHSLQEIIIYLN